MFAGRANADRTNLQIDHEQRLEAADAVHLLRFLSERMSSQLDNKDWINRAVAVARPAILLAQQIQQHEGHRTMPITNGSAKDRRALPRNLIGYRTANTQSAEAGPSSHRIV